MAFTDSEKKRRQELASANPRHRRPGSAEAGTREARMSEERLQKILSSAGVASRRKAEQMITEGRVR